LIPFCVMCPKSKAPKTPSVDNVFFHILHVAPPFHLCFSCPTSKAPRAPSAYNLFLPYMLCVAPPTPPIHHKFSIQQINNKNHAKFVHS
jgi:hypothetical protein